MNKLINCVSDYKATKRFVAILIANSICLIVKCLYPIYWIKVKFDRLKKKG